MGDKPKFNQLLPILFVKNLELEIDFYKNFGFEISYQGDEFPGFIWQMDTDSFSKVIVICDAKGIEYSKPKQYWEKMDGWEAVLYIFQSSRSIS